MSCLGSWDNLNNKQSQKHQSQGWAQAGRLAKGVLHTSRRCVEAGLAEEIGLMDEEV